MPQSEVASADSQIIVATRTVTSRNGQWESMSAWASSQIGTYVKMRNLPSITMWTVTGMLGFFIDFSDELIHPRHEAQPCYCGETNCVGFLGGKTQTDIAGMDDLYLDGAPTNEHLAFDC